MEDLDSLEQINIIGIAELLDAKCPTISGIEIEVLVIDGSTAIPYTVLHSPKSKEVKHKEILLICHDFFDNYLDKIENYKEILNKLENYILIVFNYPCQAYSLYDASLVYNNEYLSNSLDLLIYELVRRKTFHLRSDNLRFIGFGYGCNIILHFLSSTNSVINTIKACLFFNCFLYLDDQLYQFLNNSMNLLNSSKNNAYSSLLFESFASKKFQKNETYDQSVNKSNEMTTQGKINMMKGCLEIYNISQYMQMIENPYLIFVNSSHNFLISNSQKEFIVGQTSKNLTNLKDFSKNKDKKMNIFSNETGYNICEDRKDFVKELIEDFAKSVIPLDIDQRIAFIDKLLLILEESFKKFSLEDIENYQNLFTISQDLLKEKSLENEQDFHEIINGFENIKKIIGDLDEKIHKCTNVFAENHEEIQGKNDELIGKIMNIQQKKLNEFSRYLFSIKKEIENPLVNRLFIVKGNLRFMELQEDLNKFMTEHHKNLLEILKELKGGGNKEKEEFEGNLMREFKEYTSVILRLKKKMEKYMKIEEINDGENGKLQDYIKKIKENFDLAFGDIEEEIMSIFEKVEENMKEIDNDIFLNGVIIILRLLEGYFKMDTKEENKINLMSFGKKETKNEMGGKEAQLKEKIERMKLILTKNSQNKGNFQNKISN